MVSSQVCPQCGTPLIHDLCPNCAAESKASAEAGIAPGTPRKSKVLPYTISALAVFYALIGSLAHFGAPYLSQYIANQWHLARLARLHHNGPIAHPDELKGTGRIYLIQVGPRKEQYSLDDFAQRFRSNYSLDVEVLPPMTVDASALDQSRPGASAPQYVAELLFDQIKHTHPDLADDPGVYIIGFTDADMYSVNRSSSFSFTQRDQRVAVISTYAMKDDRLTRFRIGADAANQHFQARIRRILLKDVAILYWKLPLNRDPTSLLSQPLEPDLPTESIYASDLDPARTRWGQFEGEPCIFFNYSPANGIKTVAGTLIHTCSDKGMTGDESTESFEVDLRLGLLIDRHTDFDLPDTIPIEFERSTRDGWSGKNAFGISGTHNYDEFLSSADNIQIEIVHSDGGREGLVRVPRNVSNLSLVKYVDTDYSGRYYEMRWRGGSFQHYDLKRFDGSVKTFLPSNSPTVLSYLTGYRNAQGQELKFERDSERKLIQLTSPNKSWLHLTYGPGGRLAQIEDSRGRTVHYAYDERGHLISVTYPSGEIYSYEYDSTQHILTFSVARDAKATPNVILRNDYANDRLIKQTLADGSTYTYSYKGTNPINTAEVRTPDGRLFVINITDSDSTVRERDISNLTARMDHLP